jgi:orotidine-5'-phosphate decarboxylase
MSVAPRLAVALDVPQPQDAIDAAALLAGHVDIVKIGLELFVGAGPELVRRLAGDGWSVFLDLKLHDIPATVAGAVRAASGLGVELLTVHAAGGRRMLEAAAAARGNGGRPLLIGVTVLTSLDAAQVEEIGFKGSVEASVAGLARLASDAGCDGVVASSHEVGGVKAALGDGFLLVTPGIRPAGADAGDQKRIMTPAEAIAAGADYLVIGRPISAAADPAAAADRILDEMALALRRP